MRNETADRTRAGTRARPAAPAWAGAAPRGTFSGWSWGRALAKEICCCSMLLLSWQLFALFGLRSTQTDVSTPW